MSLGSLTCRRTLACRKNNEMALLVNAYSTLNETPTPDFDHQEINHRDRSDPELLQHLGEFIGFVLGDEDRPMTPSLYGVMRHLQRVKHQFSFTIDESRVEDISDWGEASNSIFFLPDASVRDPLGRVLVDPKSGLSEKGAALPYPSEAWGRLKRTHQQLNNLEIPFSEDLPPVVGESEAMLRDADDVAWRALALFVVAVRAESVASKNPIPSNKLREKSPMAFQALTAEEQAFLKDDSPDPQATINFAWRYEALYVLQWALGMHDELKFADDICDVPAVAQAMVDRDDKETVTDAKLRPVEEILDALDMNTRLFWHARQSVMEKSEPARRLDGGVLSERQTALNWLTLFEGAPWDQVDTPT